jgi:hypothetical protein
VASWNDNPAIDAFVESRPSKNEAWAASERCGSLSWCQFKKSKVSQSFLVRNV